MIYPSNLVQLAQRVCSIPQILPKHRYYLNPDISYKYRNWLPKESESFSM